jgi:hypothetical protein
MANDFDRLMAVSDVRVLSFPVLVGLVPLFFVTQFHVTEGYEKVAIAGSSFVQLVRPSAKKVVIKALLPGLWRLLRPALEAEAMTSRALAAATGPLQQVTGLPVVSKTSVLLDMQITSLVFVQDNEKRDTQMVDITLEHVPRSAIAEIVGAALDVGLAVGGPFIP